MHRKCFTCNANIKVSYRLHRHYCYQTSNSDMELNITECDTIFAQHYKKSDVSLNVQEHKICQFAAFPPPERCRKCQI